MLKIVLPIIHFCRPNCFLVVFQGKLEWAPYTEQASVRPVRPPLAEGTHWCHHIFRESATSRIPHMCQDKNRTPWTQ